jgi:hypothetical protein
MSDIPRLDRLHPEAQHRVRELWHALDWNAERAQECESTGRRFDAARHKRNVTELHRQIKAITDEANRRMPSADGD